MFQGFLQDVTLREVVFSAAVLLVSGALAWAAWALLSRAALRVARRSGLKLDRDLVAVLEGPVAAIIVLVGAYISLGYLPFEASAADTIARGIFASLSLAGIWAVIAILNVIVGWYGTRLSSTGHGITGTLLRVARWVVLLFGGLVASFSVMGMLGLMTDPIMVWMGEYGWRIAFILVLGMTAVIATGFLVPRMVRLTMDRRAGESDDELIKRGDTLARVLVNSAQILLLVIAVFMVLAQLDINIAPVLAGLGVVGIAVGFGAQSLVKDILGGVFIILENQFRVGDIIAIAGVSGLVEDINLRRTVIRDQSGAVHTVPNGEIKVATNFTKGWSRVNFEVVVSNDEDVDRVISLINRVGHDLSEDPDWAPLLLKAPQVLRVEDWTASGIKIKIVGDTRPTRQWDVTSELRRRLKRTFLAEKIKIA